MNVLLLRLAGPMQSWGVQSRFTVRDTGLEPSKSGVVGLLCAALGRHRDEPVAELADLTMGVRVDQEGTLARDYHTAGKGGILKADGTVDRKRLVVSNRYYLSDARFLVGLESDDLALLTQLHAALRDPHWPLYLGRKAFVPSEPVWLADGLRPGETLLDALQTYPWLGCDVRKYPDQVRLVLEDRGGPEVRPDQPLSFAERGFAPRRVSTTFIPAPPLKGDRLPHVSGGGPYLSRLILNPRNRFPHASGGGAVMVEVEVSSSRIPRASGSDPYLSRLILNPRHRRVQREVADPYKMHCSLMKAFSDNLEPGDERVLFRLEAHPRTGALTLLVQSLTLPDWSWLAEPGARGYLLPVGEPNPAVKSFDLHLAEGQVLAFRLRANPTARRRLPDGTRKRVGLCREEEQTEWLERKGEQGGFHVLSVRTGSQDVVNGIIRHDEVTHKLHLLAVQFDGLLQVTDPDRLRKTVRRGIGSGKALGFGLLSLARPPA